MFKCMTMQFFHEFITDKNNDVHYVILNHLFNDVTFNEILLVIANTSYIYV